MMATVNCNLTTADLWEYNIDLDADAYPIITFRPFVICGRDEHNEFFHLFALRLDGSEAARRAVAIANLAGTWDSDLNFEVYDIQGDGTVAKDGSSIPERLSVYLHNSGSLAVALGSVLAFSPFQITDRPLDLIEWLKPDGYRYA